MIDGPKLKQENEIFSQSLAKINMFPKAFALLISRKCCRPRVIGKTNKLAGRRGVRMQKCGGGVGHTLGTTDWNSRGMQVRADNKINCQIPAR